MLKSVSQIRPIAVRHSPIASEHNRASRSGVAEQKRSEIESAMSSDADGDVFVGIGSDRFRMPSKFLSPVMMSIVNDGESYMGRPLIRLSGGGIATSRDFEALLQLIYERSQPLVQADFVQTARILRAATHLEFADIREAALSRLKELYPPRPAPFASANWQHVHEATQLAIDCQAREILPALLYAIVTNSDFEVDGLEHINDSPRETLCEISTQDEAAYDESRGRILSVSTTRRCVQLMNRIMDHFTPILFTVPTSSHMKCTGVFADHWMECAIQPAIDDSGVYKPLETLDKIQRLDWQALGLCETCFLEKKEEWKREADDVWERMDDWTK